MTLEESREMAKVMDRGRAAIMEASRRGEITADDVARLRREIFVEGFVSRDEADALFALERATTRKCAEWTPFFVEAITDHVVWQTRPTGVVNEAQGEWLIARADEVSSLNGLAVLVNVMAEAHRVPMWFLAAVRARAARNWPGVAQARAEALAEAA
jgi:hypothetical protein